MITLRQAGVGAVTLGTLLLASYLIPAFTNGLLSALGAGFVCFMTVEHFGGKQA